MPTVTQDEALAALKSYRPAPISTVDRPPPEPPDQPDPNGPSNLRAAEMGRHFTEETEDPLGAAGERGEPIAQPQDLSANVQALKAYAASQEEPDTAGLRTAVKSAIETVGAVGRFPFQAASAATNFAAAVTGEPDIPSLTGLSVDQVKAARDQMVAKKADLDKTIDGIINSGQPDAGPSVVGLTQQSANIDKRIQEADGIIASGQSKFTPDQPFTALGAIGSYLRGVAASGPNVEAGLQQVFPTSQEFANSLPGKITALGGTLLPLALMGAAAPETAGATAASLFGSQQYDDLKAHGADDATAETGALITGITTLGTSSLMGPGVNMLANRLAGMTPKGAISELVKVGTHAAGTGFEFGIYQFENNAVTLLSGYDPNRPLTQGVLEQVLFGAGLSTLTQSPQLLRIMSGQLKADTTVRNRPGTPPDTGPPSEEAAAATPTVPRGTTAPVTTAEPEATAATAVQQNAGAPPEAVLANAGTPEEKLAQGLDLLGRQQTTPTVAAPAPTAQAQAEAQLGRPLETADQLAQAHAEIAQQMEDLMRQGQTQQPQVAAPRTEPPVPETAAPTPEQAQAAIITPTTPTVNLGVIPGEPSTPSTPAETRPAETEAVAPIAQTASETVAPEDQKPAPQRYNVRALDVSKPAHDLSAYIDHSFRTKAEAQAAIRTMKKAGVYQQIQLIDRKAVTPQEVKAETAKPAPFEVPRQVGINQVTDADARAKWTVWDSMLPDQQKLLKSGDQAAVDKFNREVDETKSAWEKQTAEELASRRGAEPVATTVEEPLAPADVKRITNEAGTKMGLDRYVHYIPTTESLPDRIKKTLTEGERNSTAQIVRDNGTGDVYVIGDRFHSSEDLHRALIEETLPHVYRDVSDMRVVHDPTDSRLGYYDLQSDRPVLNTDALLKTDDPFGNASRTALEEINVHQGFTKLLGPRNGKTYVDAMNSIQRNFDRLKLNDILAQRKGFNDLADMAKQYGYEDYKTNPQSQHALTEELIGSYAQGFGDRATLERSGPAWYQTALRSLNNAIRGRLGLELPDIDIQHLLSDSASALRYPKYTQEGMFHPEIDAQSKRDMAEFQLANRRPEEGAQQGELPLRPTPPTPPPPAAPPTAEGPAPAPTPPRVETANIGDLFVRAELRRTAAMLEEGQGLRAQPVKLAQTLGDFAERIGLTKPATSIYDVRTHELAETEANQIFNSLGRNVNSSMSLMLSAREPGDINPALRNLTNQEIRKQIEDLRSGGFTEQARLLEIKRDRFNQEIAARQTALGQELSAQNMVYRDGAGTVGQFRNTVSQTQQRFVGRNANERSRTQAGLAATRKVAQETAEQMVTRMRAAIEAAQQRMGAMRPDTGSLADRYIGAVAEGVNTYFERAGFKPEDRPMLQELFNTFQRNIQQQIKEKAPVPETPPREKPSPTQSIRDVLGNHEMFARTWEATVNQLKTENPNAVFFANLDRAMAEPFGETGVRRVIGEHANLRDIVYNHYSTQNRIGEDLVQKLTDGLGISKTLAQSTADLFDKYYRDLLQTTKSAELQRILDSVGTAKKVGAKPAKGELDSLIDHIAVGGLENTDWLNIIAPRFGLSAHTPEILRGMEEAGNELQRIRDDGKANSVIANKWQAQIADLIAMSQPNNLDKGWRYAESLYMASLLTGEVTHFGYFLQNNVQSIIDSYIHGFRTMRATGDVSPFLRMHSDAINGFARALTVDAPYIWKTGITPTRGILSDKPGGALPFRSPLDRDMNKLNPYRFYKFVHRVLATMEQFTVRGTQYAVSRSIATRMAMERGYTAQEASRFADEALYGTEAQQASARAEALQDAAKYGLDEKATRVREQEILDRMRTTSDNPDTAVADKETQALQDMERRSVQQGINSAMRNDTPGAMGILSRALLELRAKNPQMSWITPFIKLPANLANEFMAWTPLGIWRGSDVLKPEGTTERIQSYIGNIPGMEKKILTGQVSAAQMHDLAANQFLKGIVGSTIMGGIGAYMAANKDQDNPPFWITADGPSTYGEGQIAKAGGWQRFAVKFGDNWWSYESTPLRGILATLGGLGDYMHYEAKPDADPLSYWEGSVLSAGMAGARSFFGTPLQGLASALSFSVGRGAQTQIQLGNFIDQLVSANLLVPIGGTAVRQTYRIFNQQEYEAKGFGEKMLRSMPVVNDMLLHPKLNVFGEPITSSPIHRLWPTSAPSDPTWKYIQDNGLTLSMPGNQGKLAGIALTPDELFAAHLARGRYLKQEMDAAVQDPGFRNLSKDNQNLYIKEFENAAKQMGDQAAWEYREKHPLPEKTP